MRTQALAAFFCMTLISGPLFAQGLSGPSSVEADLTPGDGLTDPQFRSNFPRDIAPGYYAWKDCLAEKGFSFNVGYLALGQSSNADLGEGKASSGIFRFYGNWKATENGSVTFKLEDRHAYGAVAPQDFGFDSGALSIPGTAFNDNGTLLTNLFWTQRAENGAWTLQAGQIDVTDFLDVYGLVSPYTAFQNLAFSTNPTINAPNPGLGITGGRNWDQTSKWLAALMMRMPTLPAQTLTSFPMVNSSRVSRSATQAGLTVSTLTISM